MEKGEEEWRREKKRRKKIDLEFEERERVEELEGGENLGEVQVCLFDCHFHSQRSGWSEMYGGN
jgi:hypothetical protein